jgi:hypothetical protein
MDELVDQLAAKAGIDEAVAEKTIGIILGFLRSEGPSDKVQALIDKIPGAEAAITASRVNFSGSAATKSERIRWARSSQGRRASASSPKAPFAYRVS